MNFYTKQTNLSEWEIQTGMGGFVAGPFESLEAARAEVEILSAKWERNACAWNGHELNGEPTVKIENRFSEDTVCQSHQGLYVKSVAAIAEDNPTIRGNEVS